MLVKGANGVSNQINWLVCNDCGSSNLTLNELRWFNMTESYKRYTILHYNAFGSLAGVILCMRPANQCPRSIVTQALMVCRHTENNPRTLEKSLLLWFVDSSKTFDIINRNNYPINSKCLKWQNEYSHSKLVGSQSEGNYQWFALLGNIWLISRIFLNSKYGSVISDEIYCIFWTVDLML